MRRTVRVVTSAFILAVAVPVFGLSQSVEPRGYALARGTVFTNQGFSLGGAEIEVRRIDVDEDERDDTRQRAVSDRQGEFALRLPPGPSKWEITVQADDFKTDRREFEIFDAERVDFTILLRPESR